MDTEKYRTGLKRLWAAIVDWIVFLPLLLVAKWIYQTTNNISTLFAWETFVAFAPLVYSVILHYKYGQTIGKWVASVKVLDLGETRTLTLRQALYRDSFYLLVAVIGVVYHGFLLSKTDDPVGVLNDYSSFADNPVFWWTLIELITMLTNAKRRAVHDFLAKSVVVRTETSS
jgi:uncharacterized RDD family membrane protein YckC